MWRFSELGGRVWGGSGVCGAGNFEGRWRWVLWRRFRRLGWSLCRGWAWNEGRLVLGFQVRFGEGFAEVWRLEGELMLGEGMLRFFRREEEEISGLSHSLWLLSTGKKGVEGGGGGCWF